MFLNLLQTTCHTGSPRCLRFELSRRVNILPQACPTRVSGQPWTKGPHKWLNLLKCNGPCSHHAQRHHFVRRGASVVSLVESIGIKLYQSPGVCWCIPRFGPSPPFIYIFPGRSFEWKDGSIHQGTEEWISAVSIRKGNCEQKRSAGADQTPTLQCYHVDFPRLGPAVGIIALTNRVRTWKLYLSNITGCVPFDSCRHALQALLQDQETKPTREESREIT